MTLAPSRIGLCFALALALPATFAAAWAVLQHGGTIERARADERAEAERVKAERLEAERSEAERVEAERHEAELAAAAAAEVAAESEPVEQSAAGDSLEQARANLEASGGRREVREATETLVEALQKRYEADPDTYLPDYLDALDALAKERAPQRLDALRKSRSADTPD